MINGERKIENLMLRLGVALATGLWLFLYGEHYTYGAIPLFDYGAPVLSLMALIVIPAIAIGHLLFAFKPTPRNYERTSVVAAYALFFLSVIPGIYLVWFYGEVFSSER